MSCATDDWIGFLLLLAYSEILHMKTCETPSMSIQCAKTPSVFAKFIVLKVSYLITGILTHTELCPLLLAYHLAIVVTDRPILYS